MAGFQVHCDMPDHPAAMRLSDRQFRQMFIAAAKGEKNVLSEWVKPWNCRPPWSEWAEIRARIFARDDYTCQYCGERGKRLECDHITPVSRGGDHGDGNLTTACFNCNRSKRDKTIEEWRAA